MTESTAMATRGAAFRAEAERQLEHMATRAAAAEEELRYYLDRFKEATARRLECDLSDAGISQNDLSRYEGLMQEAFNEEIPVPEWMYQRVWEGGPSILKNCEWVYDRRFEEAVIDEAELAWKGKRHGGA